MFIWRPHISDLIFHFLGNSQPVEMMDIVVFVITQSDHITVTVATGLSVLSGSVAKCCQNMVLAPCWFISIEHCNNLTWRWLSGIWRLVLKWVFSWSEVSLSHLSGIGMICPQWIRKGLSVRMGVPLC